MTARDPVAPVPERAISVRLDADALRAPERLMRGGRSRSQAIRDAIVAASKSEVRERTRADAAAIMTDPAEQAELAAIRRDLFGTW
jgi:Arc/MetJ-type ribon-helix-helix transcriptional regulator